MDNPSSGRLKPMGQVTGFLERIGERLIEIDDRMPVNNDVYVEELQ